MNVYVDGPKVRGLREAAGMNRGEMPASSAISRGTLARMEREEGRVALNSARKVARALSVEPRSLASAFEITRAREGAS